MLETVDEVVAAVITGDPELLELAEIELRSVCKSVAISIRAGTYDKAELHKWRADCQRLRALVQAGHDFYSGLAAATKVQLQGYDAKTRGTPPSRLTVEG